MPVSDATSSRLVRGFGLALVGMGVLHFLVPRPFDAIMPRVLPEETHRPLTYASGVAELAAGALLLRPSTRRLGGRLAFWLLLAVWPANIDAALRGGYPIEGFAGTTAAAWIRVPLQLPMLLIARRAARGDGDGPADRTKEPTDG